MPLLINDRSGRHLDKICAGIRAHTVAGRCRIVYIDHLRLIRSGVKRARTEEIAEITSTLKGLAKELKITVVLLAQLNRNVEHRGEDAQPILSDLEGSDAIGQDADVVAFVHRKKSDDKTGIPSVVDFIVCKNRDGDEGLPPGPKLLFDRSITSFRLSEAGPQFRPEDHQ
jgi:replicative DNA helicase